MPNLNPNTNDLPPSAVATLQGALPSREKELLDALNNIRTLMLKRSTPSLRTYICDDRLRNQIVKIAEGQLQRSNFPLTKF